MWELDYKESWVPKWVKWSHSVCLTLCDPMDWSLPGSSIQRIFQARVLDWVAISFSRGSSQPRDQTQVSRIVGRCLTVWATREDGRRIDAFELWCWRRLLRVPWTARRSNQSILKEITPGCSWKDWCWSLNSNTLATWCKELTHLKRLWCWERLKAGGEGDNRGRDCWMASPTQWMRVWVNSRSWWWTGRPAMLWFMGSQRVRHNWVTELNWTEGSLGVCVWKLYEGYRNSSWHIAYVFHDMLLFSLHSYDLTKYIKRTQWLILYWCVLNSL